MHTRYLLGIVLGVVVFLVLYRMMTGLEVPLAPTPIDLPGASTETISLTSKEWAWVSTSYNDEREIVPVREGVFTLRFGSDGSLGIGTDCNSMGGTYSAADGVLEIHDLMSTQMYCEGSQEGEFVTMLSHVSGYHFTDAGELVLSLKFDSGTLLFR